jgi:hypothetical protein
MERYNPLEPPDPEEWISMDEMERIQLVEEYHRRARIRLPNAAAHALFHATVENQIALGDETPVKRTVERLMSEGLDRHDAIHAVGSALAGHIYDLLRQGDAVPQADPNPAYYAALDKLTAEAWRRSR